MFVCTASHANVDLHLLKWLHALQFCTLRLYRLGTSTCTAVELQSYASLVLTVRKFTNRALTVSCAQMAFRSGHPL